MANREKKQPPAFDPMMPVVWRDHDRNIDYMMNPARWPGVTFHNGLEDGLARGAAKMLERHAAEANIATSK